ncbi:UNVERIFIED_CONTAM: hypothetical protein Sradi_4339400 [Sesamum radiatum]|uniref:Uncharacterized protein n=1 Tax=Sesamum radiatum TaxID=300843 RepID=A0AAW2NRD3_SESRA
MNLLRVWYEAYRHIKISATGLLITGSWENHGSSRRFSEGPLQKVENGNNCRAKRGTFRHGFEGLLYCIHFDIYTLS